MKTSNLEVAQKLAMITNRPLEDFYEELGVSDSNRLDFYKRDIINRVTTENKTETISDIDQNEYSEELNDRHFIEYKQGDAGTNDSNINSTEDDSTRTSLENSLLLQEKTSSSNSLAEQYNGKLSERGFVIDNKIQMTRKEYNSITKNLTYEELFKHPLMYVLFRAEGQSTPSFPEWTSSFERK